MSDKLHDRPAQEHEDERRHWPADPPAVIPGAAQGSPPVSVDIGPGGMGEDNTDSNVDQADKAAREREAAARRQAQADE